MDVGTVMAIWFDPGEVPPGFASMPTAVPSTVPGFMTRAEAIERYAGRSGRDLARFGWYEVFGAFKLAVVLQQIFIRWKRGQTTDDRFASMGQGAQVLLEVAAGRR
jgi:aminoglycoside phosphotransferase (APT) family kinase protein